MKKILINENIEQELISNILCEAFYPTPEKVLYIKNILDKKFKQQPIDDIDSNGYPIKGKSVVMVSTEGQPLKTMTLSDLLLFLDDNKIIHSMITDDNDRKKFLKQVINDWYNKNISKYGLLSVNHL